MPHQPKDREIRRFLARSTPRAAAQARREAKESADTPEPMAPELITEPMRVEMLENGRRSAQGEDVDPLPIVKLFTPDGAATWLLTELDPDDPDIAFGLCDLGLGYPELGSVRLSEIEAVRGRLGLKVERDLYFVADKCLSAYAIEALRYGAIRA